MIIKDCLLCGYVYFLFFHKYLFNLHFSFRSTKVGCMFSI